MKNILVTGAAGFIGFHLCRKLLENGYKVVGIDNINNYYDAKLKYDRLKELGINEEAEQFDSEVKSSAFENFTFFRIDIADREKIPSIFSNFNFDIVCNLAAQAGVRYSLENPNAYIDSNIVGFHNILENCRNFKIKHLIYASSSSVYGECKNVPFNVKENVDYPVSLYAATKKSNELMAHTYSHLYNLPTTGLRFFTVYGPWGRPDMAMFLFTNSILNNLPIKVFNNGNLQRDFTYIDDIVGGVFNIIEKGAKGYSIYNIGNSTPVNLLDFISEIERQLGRTAQKEMLPMQPGDVSRTWADVENLKTDYGYSPSISVGEGVKHFILWFRKYYKV
ncbi:MAG: NAD-dependent epimerase/dehydratase family protein [Christiangramia sp.]|uniref:NAD-dependent epimerase/dehydratase family protein n=1 Tax=Christiangramia sp. TaxID=1931228 RepID=UPI0032420E91